MLAAAGLVWPQAKIICFLPDFKINRSISSSTSLLRCLSHSTSLFSLPLHFEIMFDPSAFPIRSCLRMDDELVSNIGAPHHKKVHFNDTVEYIKDAAPRTWRIKHNSVRNINTFPIFSSLRSPSSKRSGLRVSFSFFEMTIEPDGRSYTSPTTLEDEENDYWKTGAMDGEPLYFSDWRLI